MLSRRLALSLIEDGIGEGVELIESISLKRFEHREELERTIEPRRQGDGPGSLHLPPGQAHRKAPGLFGGVGVLPRQAPHQHAGLGGNQNPLEDRTLAFLFPLLQAVARLLEQLEERLDLPAEVLPERDLRIEPWPWHTVELPLT